jgi:hypothetical protein
MAHTITAIQKRGPNHPNAMPKMSNKMNIRKVFPPFLVYIKKAHNPKAMSF